MPTRGNPYAIVRLEPDIMQMLQDRSKPRRRGRGGGVSQYLRELVYLHLGLGDAPCFAEEKPTEPPAVSRSITRARFDAAPELA